MGKIRDEGLTHLERIGKLGDVEGHARIGMILGTGWSDKEVLHNRGFELKAVIPFRLCGIQVPDGAGHPNNFILGTWQNREVVISQGRVHLYQEKPGTESMIRRWMSVLLALMGGGDILISTSSVGGIAPDAKMGMLAKPTGFIAAHLPMPQLDVSQSEFAMSEPCLNQTDPHLYRKNYNQIFEEAAQQANLPVFPGDCCVQMVIPGPGFGGASERRLWAKLGIHTVGMSQDPELRLVSVENETSVLISRVNRVHVLCATIITDDHDEPNHTEITSEAKKRAPQLGAFLDAVVANFT